MQVQVTANGLERRITVALPAERIDQEVANRLRKLSQRVRIDGFRVGKVPFKVVQQRWGGSVRQEVCGELMQASFQEAVHRERLRPAGTPQFELQPETVGGGLAYTAIFEVYPDLDVKIPEGFRVTKPVVQIHDEDMEEMIDRLRRQRLQFHAVERGAQPEDRVTLDFKGSLEGKEFPGNAGQSFRVVIGSKTMVAGFEDQLLGLKAGEEKGFEVRFPEDYRAIELAGKTVHFDVKVHEVAESLLPELNEDFYKSLGVNEGGDEAFRREVRAHMERELASAIKDKVKGQVMEALLAENPLSLPSTLITNEVSHIRSQMGNTLPLPNDNQANAALTEQAARRVAIGLIVSEIVKKNEFKADAGKVRNAVESIASTYEHSEEIIRWYYGERGRLAEVEALVLEDQAVEWVLRHAQVQEQSTNFHELVGQNAASIPAQGGGAAHATL